MVHTFGINPEAKLPLIKSYDGKGINTLLVAWPLSSPNWAVNWKPNGSDILL
jgi:hypothetical protein